MFQQELIIRMKPVFGKHTFGTDLGRDFEKKTSGKVFTPILKGVGKHLNTENRNKPKMVIGLDHRN